MKQAINLYNIEFKCKCEDIDNAEKKLQSIDHFFAGLDHQLDTYFNVANGRLKVREGNIEKALIWYNREDVKDVKRSDLYMYKSDNIKEIKEILSKALGIKCIIDKARKIYYVDNVKIHFDEVKGLGSFLEVEAICIDESKHDEGSLKKQCDHFIEFFSVEKKDLIDISYSDMLKKSMDFTI